VVGTAMTGTDWSDRSALAVAVYLDGSDQPDRAADGTPMLDDDFLVLVSAWWQPPGFTISATRAGLTWQTAIDTYDPARTASAAVLRAGAPVNRRSAARCLMMTVMRDRTGRTALGECPWRASLATL
jgi:isoamylase